MEDLRQEEKVRRDEVKAFCCTNEVTSLSLLGLASYANCEYILELVVVVVGLYIIRIKMELRFTAAANMEHLAFFTIPFGHDAISLRVFN